MSESHTNKVGKKIELLLEELRQGYKDVWDNKNSLDDKAMKLTTISSIMGAIIFGFSSILFSNSSIINLFNTNSKLISSEVVFCIIIISIILAIGSIIYSLKAISIRSYRFVAAGSVNETKELIVKRLKQVYLEKYFCSLIGYEKTIYDFMTDYINAIAINFSHNQTKAKDIMYSFYLLIASTSLVAVALIMLMINLIIK
jgi:hypothetical protein